MSNNSPTLRILPPGEDLETVLRAEHAEIYRKFLPTLDSYSAMAKGLLEVQVKLFDEMLRFACPGAEHSEEVLITNISARETLSHVEKILAEMAKQKFEVTRINYDPKTFVYSLYGKC